jgi:hypothetical protein
MNQLKIHYILPSDVCFQILNLENESLWKSEKYDICSLDTEEALSFFRREVAEACKKYNIVPILTGKFNEWYSKKEEMSYLVQKKTKGGWVDANRFSSKNDLKNFQISLRRNGHFGTFRMLRVLGIVDVKEFRDSGADGVEPGILVLFHDNDVAQYLFVGDVVETINHEVLTIKNYNNETGLFDFAEEHKPMLGEEFISRKSK